jgi:hypothetical protein
MRRKLRHVAEKPCVEAFQSKPRAQYGTEHKGDSEDGGGMQRG